jgi:hypothetical protein
MKHRVLSLAVATTLAAVGTPMASADGGKSSFSTNLIGYQETPVTINSPGSGEFAAKISKDGSEIQYVLSYRGLTTNVLQAHIHFGRPAITGGIVLFLRTNLTPPANVPAPPACPQAPTDGSTVTVSGTLTVNLLMPSIANVALPTQESIPGWSPRSLRRYAMAPRTPTCIRRRYRAARFAVRLVTHDHGDEDDDD